MGRYAQLIVSTMVLTAALACERGDAQQVAQPANQPEMAEATTTGDKGKTAVVATARHRVRFSAVDPGAWSDDSLTVANLGHSTLLINYFGVRVIADPVLLNRIGIAFGRWFTIGPRRLRPPALDPTRLGPLNVILITHAHMDHLDVPSLARLPKNAVVVACSGCADLIQPLGFVDVRELNWGESTKIAGLTISAFGARHWGQRLPWGKDRGYNSYVLDKNDSAYTPIFRELAPLKLAIAAFSIGAYDPWIAHHANPEQAWKMFKDSGAEYLLPIHWGTFRLSKEPLDDPLARLANAAGSERWRIVAAKIGEPWRLPAPQTVGSSRHDSDTAGATRGTGRLR
jgi:L-ascorbate metabolism protein UlaG (beta-lactamase superfamily)